jgi:catechol 2,3-dioxygenase-like lactoylglutathione lyase family enzyme
MREEQLPHRSAEMTDEIDQPMSRPQHAVAGVTAEADDKTARPVVTRRRVIAAGIVASTTLALEDIALADDALTPNTGPFASWRPVHAGLRVPDRDAAILWYTEKLDFRVVQTVPFSDDMTFVFLSPAVDDGFRLELQAGPGATERPAYADLGASLGLSGWHHLCLRVDSVDRAISELGRRGVTIVQEPFDVPAISGRIAFFSDPWGNIFELMEPVTA